jgi:hypothetical protein
MKRLRINAGAYKIPMKIEAGDLGSWGHREATSSVREEKIVTSTKADSVKVTFLDDQQMPVDLFFPIDFTQSDAASVFITQRGPNRLRLAAYPDAVAITEVAEGE